MTENHADPDRKKVIRLYSAFGASLVLMVVPNMIAMFVSLVLLLGVLIAAYSMRKKSAGDSLGENHGTFIIRTVWISGFFAVLTVAAASFYMLPNVDNTALQPCLDTIMADAERLMLNQDTLAVIAEMENIIQPCVHPFVESNFKVFGISMIIAAAPVLLYLIVRFTRGLSRAVGGYRVSHPKGWF